MSGSYGLAFIVNQKWKSKIHKLEKVDDSNPILQPARSRDKRQKDMDKKPRYESRKMVLDQAQRFFIFFMDSNIQKSQNLFVNWEELGSTSLRPTLRKSQF